MQSIDPTHHPTSYSCFSFQRLCHSLSVSLTSPSPRSKSESYKNLSLPSILDFEASSSLPQYPISLFRRLRHSIQYSSLSLPILLVPSPSPNLTSSKNLSPPSRLHFDTSLLQYLSISAISTYPRVHRTHPTSSNANLFRP